MSFVNQGAEWIGCYGQAAFGSRNGVPFYIRYMLDRQGKVLFASAMNPLLRIPVHPETSPTYLIINGRHKIRGIGFAGVKGQKVVVMTKYTPRTANLLKRGSTITFSFRGYEGTFKLTGTAALFARMEACVNSGPRDEIANITPPQRPLQPRQPASPPALAAQPRANSAISEAELVRMTANVLSLAGVKNYLISESNANSVSWVAPQGLSGMVVLFDQPAKSLSLTTLLQSVKGVMAGECPGEVEIKNIKNLKFKVICITKKKKLTSNVTLFQERGRWLANIIHHVLDQKARPKHNPLPQPTASGSQI